MASSTSSTPIAPAVKSPYAYVTFVMCGDTYVLAALVLAYSLRMQKTTADTVCLITADVSKPAETALKALFTKVIKVPYLSGSPEKCTWNSGKRFVDMYNPWIHKSFTRFQALRVEGYEKICVIDADALCLNNPDEIFRLEPPAAIVSRIGDRGYKFKHRHGERIDQKEVGSKPHQSGASCGILLLKPNAEDYRAMVAQVRNHGGFGDPKCHWGPDEQLVTQHYNRKCGWTNISRKFWCTAWRQEDLQEVQVDATEVEPGPSSDTPLTDGQNGYEATGGGAENRETLYSDGLSPATARKETVTVQEKARFIHYVSEKPWRSSEVWPDMVEWRETAKKVLKSIHVVESEPWVVQGWNK